MKSFIMVFISSLFLISCGGGGGDSSGQNTDEVKALQIPKSSIDPHYIGKEL